MISTISSMFLLESFKSSIISIISIIFWFTLLRNYIKEEKKKVRNKIFRYIKKCEIRQNEQIGFKLSLDPQKQPDIYSTYLALGSLKSLGLLKEYFTSEGQGHIKEEIKSFILSHRKGNSFLHCHDKECDKCGYWFDFGENGYTKRLIPNGLSDKILKLSQNIDNLKKLRHLFDKDVFITQINITIEQMVSKRKELIINLKENGNA